MIGILKPIIFVLFHPDYTWCLRRHALTVVLLTIVLVHLSLLMMLFTFFFYNYVQEFVEARRTASAGLNNAPSCQWSPSAPQELEGIPAKELSANAGFVSFGKATVAAYMCPVTPVLVLLSNCISF